MKPNKLEITNAITELQDAMLEALQAQTAEDNAKLRKIKAHKRLALARDEIRALTFHY